MPVLRRQNLRSFAHTGSWIRKLVRGCWRDVEPFRGWTLRQYFRMVADLPYIEDPVGDDGEPEEALARPSVLLSPDAPFRDCDDKNGILLGSFLYMHGVKFRCLAVSFDPLSDPCHLVAEAMLDGRSTILDATYPGATFPNGCQYYNDEPMSGWI